MFGTGFVESMSQCYIIMILVIIYFVWLLRKAAEKNPALGDAAKRAATNKAINIIGRWFK